MKTKTLQKVLLLIAITILLVGLVSATTTNKTSTTKDTKVVKESSKTSVKTATKTVKEPAKKVTNNTVSKKKIIKNYCNISKKSDIINNASSYDELVSNVERANYFKNYTINLKKGTYTANNNLNWSNSEKLRTLKINGNGAILDGDNEYSFLRVNSGFTLILNNITLRNYAKYGEYGSIPDLYGGAIFNEGTLIIKNSKFINNHADAYGGAIHNEGGILSIENSLFEDNYASTMGGAISSQYGLDNINIQKSTFKNNDAGRNGGAIYSASGNAIIYENIFINNYATKNGGAIINGMIIEEPSVRDSYGDVLEYRYITYGKNTEIRNNRFISNKAYDGSAIYNRVNSVLIDSNLFNFNQASSSSTGIVVSTTEDIISYNNNYNSENRYYNTIYNDGEDTSITNNLFDDSKITTKLLITCNNNKPYVNETIKIRFILKDEYNNILSDEEIETTINNKNYLLYTNSENITEEIYTPNKTGNQTISATYAGNSFYDKSTNQIKINVKNKIQTKITIKLNTTKPYKGSKVKATLTLKDNNGNVIKNQKLTLKIGTKTCTIKTNNKGIATKTYKTTKTGTIKITATYNGATAYLKSTKTTKMKVLPKIKTKLTLKLSKNKAKVKDKIKITATLKNKSNKAIKNQKVAFKIGSKTYNKKTNNKGMIIINYKVVKSALGKALKATYKGNYMYIKSKASKKLLKA